MSVGKERGWVGRIPVPQTGFPCGTTLVSVVSVLKKPTRVRTLAVALKGVKGQRTEKESETNERSKPC